MSRPTPTNYTANVNRAKTKKWVEAKSYSYDGDDWGDVDDYDEYGGYDEPEPEPAPKPTGLRQRGQSASQTPPEGFDGRQDLHQSPVDNRQQYENYGGPLPQQQEQPYYQEARGFTNPQARRQPAMGRTNSFDRDDERRAFSAGGPPQQYANNTPSGNSAAQSQGHNIAAHDFQSGHHPQDYSRQNQPASPGPPSHMPNRKSMEGQRKYGDRMQSPSGNFGGAAFPDHVRLPSMDSRTQSMASSNSAMEFHNRRDFSPSAIPPPLQTRGSPSPHGPDGNSSSRPPRKSSLGQAGSPSKTFDSQTPSMTATGDAEEDMSSARDRAGSGTGKQLPFVRPAEIYRRMQEEKERERQSQESSRPSMEAITGRSNDRPALGRRQDSESSQRLKPALDAVTERRSEYGMEGLKLQDQGAPGERRSTSKSFDFPKRMSRTGSQIPKSSLGPVLPDVSRVSGFGESFFGTTENSSENPQSTMLSFARSSSPDPAPQVTQTAPPKDLQHQPSLGFTSAVHQAFDKAEDQVPPTPSSTQGSSVARSTSGGTSTVSPIISRGPSTATESWNSRLPPIDNVSTPMIPEAPERGSSRPVSVGSSGTPTQVARKTSPPQSLPSQEVEQPPQSFIPGYRRNSDTPSPDNSPRRTPALETTRPLRQPQEIELAAATPTDPSYSTNGSSQASDIAPDEGLSREPSMSAASEDNYAPQMNPHAGPRNLVGKPDSTVSPISPSHDRLRDRTDSSSSSRVRNLADKFESGSRPGSAQSTTPRASLLGGNIQRKDDLVPPRPLADRMESFRPHLPGGWESSASIAPAAAFNASYTSGGKRQVDPMKSPVRTGSPSSGSGKALAEREVASPPEQQPSAVSQMKDASEDAFAAVAAAGSALAGAFGSAVGMQNQGTPSEPTSEASHAEPKPTLQSGIGAPNIYSRGALHPEASRPSVPAISDEENSTAAPTPLPKDDPMEISEIAHQVGAPDYFPSSAFRDVRDGIGSEDEGKPLRQPPALPLLSTDTRPQQYESDRLRKEIVRELTPMSPSEPTTAETDYSNYQATLSTNPSVTRPERESGVLPKEYESYWNDANSEDEVDGIQGSPHQGVDTGRIESQRSASAVVPPLQSTQGYERVTPGPPTQGESSRGRSPMLPHRFSWEQPLPQDSKPAPNQSDDPKSDFLKSAVYPDGHFEPSEESPRIHQTSTVPATQERATSESPIVAEREHFDPSHSDNRDIGTGATETNKKLPSYPGGLEVVHSPVERQPNGSPIVERTDSANLMKHQSPVSQFDQPQESTSLPFQPSLQVSADAPLRSIDLPPPASSQPKFPAFREILALKTPAERIQAYNETREQFAAINTGLAHWLAVTANDLPEHADLLASAGRLTPNFQGHKPSPSRSKLGGLLPSGGQSNQQPYFQQYLNASPQPPAPDGSTPGSGIGGGTSQGFSPSGTSNSKLSSQQVQAKGKDLLHTAGVFGGKANVAAKGLFSKGKSKLRAASGNEKGTSRQSKSSDPPSRGMQQRTPSVQLQAFDSPQGQGVQSRSPQNTPSADSFTQSQFGDDERSEESEPISRSHPPRNSSLHVKNGVTDLATSEPMQNPVTIGDNAPIFLKETPSAGSYIGSPKEIHTPRSATSSNKTPTQANFTHSSFNDTAPVRQVFPGKTFFQQESQDEIEAHDDEGDRPYQLSPTRSLMSTTLPCSSEDPVTTPTKPNIRNFGSPQKGSSGDSKSTIRNVNTDDYSNGSTVYHIKPPDKPYVELDRISRAPARMSALAASEVSPNDPTHRNGSVGRTKSRPVSRSVSRPVSRPVTPNHNSLGVPRASGDYLTRGPSMDSLPSRIDLDRPPSPVSPEQTIARQTYIEQSGRNGPIHYGIDHDFVPDSNHDRIRNRSRSVSRSRLSQDSRRSQEPSIHDHPAFRASSEIPAQSYSGQITRDETLMSRQQAPEYDIEGVGPALEWPSERKSRSRRGSRSSAFFRSLTPGGSSKADEPPLPHVADSQPLSSGVSSPNMGGRRSRRASILRSLTGNSGSGSGGGQSKRESGLVPSTSQHAQSVQAMPPPPPPPPQGEDDEFPSRGNSKTAKSKLSKRIHRSSTSAKPEPDGGKKKRFSAIGSLFGRGNTKRQSSSTESPQAPPITSRQSSAAPAQQRDMNENAPISRPQQHGYELPKPRDPYNPPPPGGYYAPSTAQPESMPPPATPELQHNGHSSWKPDTSAYVQDASLRQHIDRRMSPQAQPQIIAQPRPSATFSQASPQHSSYTLPRSSTTGGRSQEPLPQRSTHSTHGSKTSGSTWTRFSQHGRSKSRQEQPRPPSIPAQQPSPQYTTAYPSPPRAYTSQVSHPSYPSAPRSDSPPPPPPPPKDDWHQAWPLESTFANPAPRTSQHTQTSSQTFTGPLSDQNRQSLPPLQTDMTNKRRSNMSSAKTLTPEEKRRSRQQEIERSTLSPQTPTRSGGRSAPGEMMRREDESVVMSATSFPGQEWQPEYAHWDGD